MPIVNSTMAVLNVSALRSVAKPEWARAGGRLGYEARQPVSIPALGSALSARTGLALLGLLAASLVAAQIPPEAPKPSVIALLWKWTPLLAEGFLFNLLISFCAMAVGTAAGC